MTGNIRLTCYMSVTVPANSPLHHIDGCLGQWHKQVKKSSQCQSEMFATSITHRVLAHHQDKVTLSNSSIVNESSQTRLSPTTCPQVPLHGIVQLVHQRFAVQSCVFLTCTSKAVQWDRPVLMHNAAMGGISGCFTGISASTVIGNVVRRTFLTGLSLWS